MELQYKIKQNASEMQDAFLDIEKWEKEIKEKELKLTGKKIPTEVYPKIRPKYLKKKITPKKSKTANVPKLTDYQNWDKFDVDKALEEIDKESDYESSLEDEEENSGNEDLLDRWKTEGNDLFKEGNLIKAIEVYSNAISHFTKEPTLYANRALALMKQEKHEGALEDLNEAIDLDRNYTKAYYRRALILKGKRKFAKALKDMEKVLSSNPDDSMFKNVYNDILNQLEKDKEFIKLEPIEIEEEEFDVEDVSEWECLEGM